MKLHVVFFSDSHLGFDYPIKPKLNIRRRGIDFFNNFKYVLRYAAKNHVDFVIHGGDLFFRSKVPGLIIDKTYQILLSFAQSGLPIYIVPGNHERSQLPQSLLVQHPNIHIFSQPKTYIHIIDNTKIALSGFPCERKNIRGNFHDLLRKSGWYETNSDIKLLCLHQTIEGACVGPSDYMFKSGQDIIPLTFLPKDATVVLVGHIHRQQEINSQNTPPVPVLFSGSIERTSFSEKNETKGFYHLCFTYSLQDSWALSEKYFIHLKTRPMIDIHLLPEMTKNQIEQILLKNSVYHKDAIIRIKFDYPAWSNFNSPLTSQWLRKILPQTVNFVLSRNFDKNKANI